MPFSKGSSQPRDQTPGTSINSVLNLNSLSYPHRGNSFPFSPNLHRAPISADDLPPSLNRKNPHCQIGIFPAPIFSCLLSQGQGDPPLGQAEPALSFEICHLPPPQAPGFTGFLLCLLYFPSVHLYQPHPTGSLTCSKAFLILAPSRDISLPLPFFFFQLFGCTGSQL